MPQNARPSINSTNAVWLVYRKEEEFKRSKREAAEIVEVRYNFYHERREYKLLLIGDLI